MKSYTFGICIILSGLIFSCETRDFGSHQEREESFSNISHLVLNGNFETEIIQGDEEKLILSGPEELVQAVQVKQTDERLEISLKEEMEFVLNDESVDLILTVQNLSILDIAGAGSFHIQPYLQTNALKINCSGAGKMDFNIEADEVHAVFSFVGKATFKGATDNFHLENSGIGEIIAAEFSAKNVDLVTSGIGNVEIFASETLAMDVSGIGKVKHSGNAEITRRNVSGIGDVEKVESKQNY
ncbi:head GIN domain-containing protein [Algoriphagus hitonicola]|uniref:Putative auto-transporter adhesin, head GIN domain n=1 Tax=Algoriphagus hitonicola TaxID=435880 RepID=A0A1I2R480_9BACT|nr:head GIN domain-containing protein [Algoriphagus hitonicola]SFG35504.1 Putative auto-transporter adhesin, head GIN domain [Algoriphagus hitonicola]